MAVQNRRKDVVEYLLAIGVPVGPNHAKAATLNKDTAVLELFLEYGWDINDQIEWAAPPAFA